MRPDGDEGAAATDVRGNFPCEAAGVGDEALHLQRNRELAALVFLQEGSYHAQSGWAYISAFAIGSIIGNSFPFTLQRRDRERQLVGHAAHARTARVYTCSERSNTSQCSSSQISEGIGPLK